MIPLTDKENKSYKKQKVCYICKKGFCTNDNNKKYHKVRDHCHYTGKYIEELFIKFVIKDMKHQKKFL